MLILTILWVSIVNVWSASKLDPATNNIQGKLGILQSSSHLHQADLYARVVTHELLRADPTKTTTPEDTEALVKAHLFTELYYAFNTQNGNRTRDHRLIYDFIIHMQQPEFNHDAQKQHITILTILSLAAQEYFWNPQSNVDDLRKHVRRELRYGLYRMPGNKLKVDDRMFLLGDLVEHNIQYWVSGELVKKLQALYQQLTTSSTGLLKLLRTPLENMLPTQSPKIYDLSKLDNAGKFGILKDVFLAEYGSAMDGLCGYHSMFIPNDGPREGYKNNARAKMLQAFEDHIDDPDLDKFYFMHSQFAESSTDKITALFKFDTSLQAQVVRDFDAFKKALDQEKEKEEMAARQKHLEGLLNFTVKELQQTIARKPTLIGQSETVLATAAFKAFIDDIEAMGFRVDEDTSWDDLIGAFFKLELLNNVVTAIKATAPSTIGNILKYIKEHPSIVGKTNPKEAEGYFNSLIDALNKAGKNIVLDSACTDVLRHYISWESLITKHKLKIVTYQDIKAPGGSRAVARNIGSSDKEAVYVRSGDIANSNNTRLQKQFEYYHDDTIEIKEQKEAELMEWMYKNLWPKFKANPSWKKEVVAAAIESAKNDGIKSGYGWMVSSSNYHRLWALAHHENVIIWHNNVGLSSSVNYFDVDHMKAHSSKPHTHNGYYLQDVIWTSPRAKFIYMLNKGNGHYDKFIKLNDWSSLAKQLRHQQWMGISPYEIYPF